MRTILIILLVATLSIFAACGKKDNNEAPVNNYYANPNQPTNTYPNVPGNYLPGNHVPGNYIPGSNTTYNCEYNSDENTGNGWNSFSFFESCLSYGQFPTVYYNNTPYHPSNYYNMVYNEYRYYGNGDFQTWYCNHPNFSYATYGSNRNSFCGQQGFFVSGSIAFNSSNGGTLDASTALGVAALVGLGIIFTSF